jgi:hypothetical protein
VEAEGGGRGGRQYLAAIHQRPRGQAALGVRSRRWLARGEGRGGERSPGLSCPPIPTQAQRRPPHAPSGRPTLQPTWPHTPNRLFLLLRRKIRALILRRSSPVGRRYINLTIRDLSLEILSMTAQPTETQVPRISLTVPARSLAIERARLNSCNLDDIIK